MTFHAGYAGVAQPSTRHLMADAWASDQARKPKANMHTDGKTIYSYNHVVGVTVDDTKIAFDCHYSVTTAKQCGPVKAVADVVTVGCPSCRAYHGEALTVAAIDSHSPPQWALSDRQLLGAE